jgi:hypothetical protein
LKATFRERLKKKLKLAIIGIPKTIIVEVANLVKEIEEEMPTPHKSRRSQLLSDNEDLDEELTNDEYKKEKRKNHKEHDDEY